MDAQPADTRGLPGIHKSPRVVLDTNVVLDWLLFDDPRFAALAAALDAGRVRWIASLPMREELASVLVRGIVSRPGHAVETVLASFDRRCRIVSPAPLLSLASMRCTDAHDQQFIDLALHQGVQALVSRDRAVLRLARRAADRGLCICVPERWSMPESFRP